MSIFRAFKDECSNLRKIPYKTLFKSRTPLQYYATQVQLEKKVPVDVKENFVTRYETEWKKAKPFSQIPGPSRISLVASFMPGGKYYKKTLIDIYQLVYKEYGDIMMFPGMFGKRNLILTFDPKNFEKVFRTEGPSPMRRGLDTITYYRKVERADFYKHAGGLVAEQGEGWADFRTKVNPIMIQPKTVKQYISSIDKVTLEFIERIRKIRNSTTNEVPSNFEEDIHHWTLESIGLVALDTRLGLINEIDNNPDAQRLIEALTTFFNLLYELDVKPSLWKIIPTIKFKQMMNIQDVLTELTTKYIDVALKRIKDGEQANSDEESVLQKLVKVDKQVAIVMAMDLMIAGVDTTTSAFVGCLFQLAKNPDKQRILREELKKILPKKDSPLSKDNMKNLPYLRACIKEALRLYPVTVGNFRTTGQDVVLSGYRVPKGVDITMASLVLQRDDAHFPKALKFLPERWLRILPDNSECTTAKTAHPFIYLPFGFGPRMCVGKRFVELELEVVLSRVFRNYHVEYHYPDFIFQTNVINFPSGDFRFKFVDLKE